MSDTVQAKYYEYRAKYPSYNQDAIIDLMVKDGVISIEIAKKISSGISLFMIDNTFEKSTGLNSLHTNVPQDKELSSTEITQNIINCINNKFALTMDISDIDNIISKQLTPSNVVEILSEVNQKSGKSLVDIIASYKFVDDETRKKLVLKIVNKLEIACKNNNQDVLQLINILKRNINYEFKKVGFIELDNINALFKALMTNATKNKVSQMPKNANDINKEFLLNNTKKYSKKEEIYKQPFDNSISGKNIIYTGENGEKLIEVYIYNKETNEYVLDLKKWVDSNNITIKIATYYPDNNSNLQSVHYYENNEQIETHHFRQNGIERFATEFKNNAFKTTNYSLEGKPIETRIITNPSDENSRTDSKTTYDLNGYEQIELTSKKNYLPLEKYYLITKEQLKDFYRSPYLERLPYDYLQPLKLGEDVACDVLKALYDKVIELSVDRKIDIKDLTKNFTKLINEKDISKAVTQLKYALGRVTKNYSITTEKDYNNNIEIDGNIASDFYQGNFGTCWLTSAVKALTLSSQGRELLKQTVKKDEKSGVITITLKGAPNGKQVYRYTAEQIKQASELSYGDGDERAIEMAFRDLFLSLNKDELTGGKLDINGNSTWTAFKILTGNNTDSYAFMYRKEKPEETTERMNGLIEKLKKDKNLCCICGFSNSFFSCIEKENEIKTFTEIINCHAYTVKQVDDNYVYLINPWNTSKTIKISIDDFKNYCESLTIAEP